MNPEFYGSCNGTKEATDDIGQGQSVITAEITAKREQSGGDTINTVSHYYSLISLLFSYISLISLLYLSPFWHIGSIYRGKRIAMFAEFAKLFLAVL